MSTSNASQTAEHPLAQTALVSSKPFGFKAWLVMLYSAVAYLLFFVTFLALIAFVGDLWALRSTPKPWLELDGTAAKVALNLGLLLLFAVQHTIMARGRFKQWITRYIPQAAERSTFVLATVAVLVATMALWQPLPLVLFQLEGVARIAIHVLFALGFGIVLAASFMIDHFQLFGLKQGIHALLGQRPAPPRFYTPLLYRWVRHPLMTGMLLGIWAATDLTAGRLLLAVAMSGYIAIGLMFEERSLIRELGDTYRLYKRHVPAVIPGLRPAWPPRSEPFQGTSAAPEAA